MTQQTQDQNSETEWEPDEADRAQYKRERLAVAK